MTDAVEMFAEMIRLDPDRALSARLRALISEGKACEIAHNSVLSLSGVAAIAGGLMLASGVATVAMPAIVGCVCYAGVVVMTAAISGNVRPLPFVGGKGVGELALHATTGISVDDGITQTWLEYLPYADRSEVLMLGSDDTRRQMVSRLKQAPADSRLSIYRRWQESLQVAISGSPDRLIAALSPANEMPELRSAAAPSSTQIEQRQNAVTLDADAWGDPEPEDSEDERPIEDSPESKSPPFYRGLLKVPFLWIKGRPESHAQSIAELITIERSEKFGSKNGWIGISPKYDKVGIFSEGVFGTGFDPAEAKTQLESADTIVVAYPEKIPPDQVDAFSLWEVAAQAKYLIVVSDASLPGSLSQLIQGRDRADIVAICNRDEFGELVPSSELTYTRSGEKKEDADGSFIPGACQKLPSFEGDVKLIAPTQELIDFSNFADSAPPKESAPPENKEAVRQVIIQKILDFMLSEFRSLMQRDWYDTERKTKFKMAETFLHALTDSLDDGDVLAVEDLRARCRWLKIKGGVPFLKNELAPELIKCGYLFDGRYFRRPTSDE